MLYLSKEAGDKPNPIRKRKTAARNCQGTYPGAPYSKFSVSYIHLCEIIFPRKVKNRSFEFSG